MDPLRRVKILDLTGKLRLEIRRVKSRDRRGTALPLNQVGPERLNVIAQGRQGPQTRDCDATKLQNRNG